MNNKKKLIFLGLDVLVLIVTIGVSLAVFNYVKKGESSNKVTIGGITMNFTEGERNISIPVATPASDEEGKVFGLDNIENQKCTNDSDNNVQCYTDFTISTNMNIDYSISYEVTLDKDETSTLSNSDVRIYLEKQDENGEYKEVFTPKEYTPIDSENPTETDELGASNSEMLLDSGDITKSITYYYRLRMWVKGDYKITEAIKDFSAKINVYGSNVEVNASTGINLTLDGNKINDKTITLQKGEQNKKVIAEVLPDNTKNKNLIWESSDTSKVKIDSAGNLSLDNIGTSVIRVSTSDRSKSVNFTINVVNPSVSSIELPETLTLSKGNHETLTPTITPSDAVYDNITWSSSSEGIATVTNGYIEAVGIGETDITAETNGKTSTCHVIVTVPNVSEIVIDGIDTVDAGKTIKLTATTESDSLAESNIIWTSSDETLATVSSTGTVAGIAKGTVTITAYIKEHPDIKATKEITVRNILSKELTFSGNQTVNVGATPSFVATITPSDARDVEYIKWSSSDSSIASIPESCNTNHTTTCNIETLKKGTATITVETKDKKDGETYRSATVILTVNQVLLNNYITNLYNSGNNTLINVNTDEYRYSGRNVNNYVNFNEETAGWRIIGIVDGSIKLVRATSIGTIAWDSTNSNNWDKPATLKTLLNSDDYYTRTGDYSNIGLTESAKNMIKNHTWKLGAIAKSSIYDTSDDYSTINFYNSERSTLKYGNNPIEWTGKIALIYPSDYGYASSSCYNTINIRRYDNEICKTTNWLYSNIPKWFLTASSDYNAVVYHVTANGNVNHDGTHTSFTDLNVFPTLYLVSNIVINNINSCKIDGTIYARGSEQCPYNIQLGT